MREVEDVFRLGAGAVVVVDVEAVEELVEAADPHVEHHLEGGLEDGTYFLGVVHRHVDRLGAEGDGFARAEAGA